MQNIAIIRWLIGVQEWRFVQLCDDPTKLNIVYRRIEIPLCKLLAWSCLGQDLLQAWGLEKSCWIQKQFSIKNTDQLHQLNHILEVVRLNLAAQTLKVHDN